MRAKITQRINSQAPSRINVSNNNDGLLKHNMPVYINKYLVQSKLWRLRAVNRRD